MHGDKMGHYFKLWIISDVMLIWLTHFNIYVEFKCNCRNDLKRIEYIVDKASESIKKADEEEENDESECLVKKKHTLHERPKT